MINLPEEYKGIVFLTSMSALLAGGLAAGALNSPQNPTEDVHFQFDNQTTSSIQVEKAAGNLGDYDELLRQITEQHISEAAADSDLSYFGPTRDYVETGNAHMKIESAPVLSTSMVSPASDAPQDMDWNYSIDIDDDLAGKFRRLSNPEAQQVLEGIQADFIKAVHSVSGPERQNIEMHDDSANVSLNSGTPKAPGM